MEINVQKTLKIYFYIILILTINFYKVVHLTNVFLSFLVIPVKLGIIGVMNRSQLDINNKKVSIIKTTQLKFVQIKCSLIAILHSVWVIICKFNESTLIRSLKDHKK